MDIGKQFKGKLITVDTSIFIYFIEEHPKYLDFVNDFFLRNHEGDFNDKRLESVKEIPVIVLEKVIEPIEAG